MFGSKNLKLHKIKILPVLFSFFFVLNHNIHILDIFAILSDTFFLIQNDFFLLHDAKPNGRIMGILTRTG